MRLVISYEEPPPKIKLPAPKKISPPSKLTTAVISDFQALQKQLADFVQEWGGADLGDLKVKDPLFPLHLTVDTELLIIAAHNRRHLWQAENVKKNAGFPAWIGSDLRNEIEVHKVKQVRDRILLCASVSPGELFYCARSVPPSASSAFTICADHCATSSSRSVRSCDWNSAWSSVEYFPVPTFSPR